MVCLAWLLGLALVAGVAPALRSAEDDDKESAKKVDELVARYEFFADADQKDKFERHDKPLLKYTNPVRGSVFGNVFVWTHQGRPEVIGTVFDFRTEGTCYTELHSLARPGVVAARDGKAFWKPAKPGVAFQPVPGAPAPAETAAGRLRQMREMSRDFAVEREHPEHGKEALRLLTQPIFRYDSPPTKTLDGAAFAFADATTDPEAFLLLEASGDKPVWRFAFARMNIVEFRATHKGKPVWQVEAVDWASVYDRQEPYAIVNEKNRRGLTRTP